MACEGGRRECDHPVADREVFHACTDPLDAPAAFHAQGRAGEAVFKCFLGQKSEGPHHVPEVETARLDDDLDLLVSRRAAGKPGPGQTIKRSLRRDFELEQCIRRADTSVGKLRTARQSQGVALSIAENELALALGICQQAADLGAQSGQGGSRKRIWVDQVQPCVGELVQCDARHAPEARKNGGRSIATGSVDGSTRRQKHDRATLCEPRAQHLHQAPAESFKCASLIAVSARGRDQNKTIRGDVLERPRDLGSGEPVQSDLPRSVRGGHGLRPRGGDGNVETLG